MSDGPRRDFTRAPRSSSQFDAKPESRRDRGTTYGASAFGERSNDRARPARPARSIGGYDVDFVSEQRALDRDRFAPRTPRPTGDRPAPRGGSDRPARSGGYERRPASTSRSSERPARDGARPAARPRLSSRPAA